MLDNELRFSSGEGLTITRPKEIRELHFIGEKGDRIGRFYWENELKFEGNAEESAKVFIKWLKELWHLV